MSKISELSDGGVIQGGDTLIAVRSGGNVKVTYGGSTTANIDGGTIDGTVIGGSTAAAITGTTITGTSFVSSGDMTFGDNDKAIFGAGSDLQIYHDGSNSRIQEAGTGNLIIRADDFRVQSVAGEAYIEADANGAVALRYDNSAKLATTATGIDVTGTVTADGLTVDGNAAISSSNVRLDLFETDTTDLNTRFRHNGGQLLIRTTTDDGLTDTTRMSIDHATGDLSLYDDTGTTAKFFWDASAESLTVGNSSGLTNTAGFSNTLGVKGFLPSITIEDTGTGTGKYTFGVTSGNFGLWDSTRNAYLLYGNSAGNLLVGRTSSGTLTVAGSEFQASGAGFHIRDGGTALYVGRKTSDGNLVEFSKDGTAVGSIGTAGGDFVINGTTLGLLATAGSGNFGWNSSIFYPTADNARDLGTASFRFDDVYATNGTIQTSDRNEKQDIEELSEAEQRVAVAAKGLLRKFRWKDSVEEKGDDARVHFGIIAQDLQAAFEAEGLDAGRYAMFISSTWTDEETGEERSRMGVRYSELLAFIIAAI